jgi:regulation of enolase protein 1 (concanavalin A-like superfamily)
LDNTQLFIAYHTHISSLFGGARQLNLDRVNFVSNGTHADRMVIEDTHPSQTPKPYPSGSPPTPTAVNDEFNAGQIDTSIWKNIYNFDDSQISFASGRLRIQMNSSTLIGSDNDGGNVFLQAAPLGDWSVVTKVDMSCNTNYAQAFLVAWQDSENYIMCKTVYSNGYKFAATKEQNETVTQTLVPNQTGLTDAYLRITKTGSAFSCAYSADGSSWTTIGSPISFDPMYELKVGLGAWKDATFSGIYRAKFDFFHVIGLSPPPHLDYVVTNANLILSWPAAYTGWTLESQTNSLATGLSTNWTPVAGSETKTNALVPLNLLKGAVFYRLQYH